MRDWLGYLTPFSTPSARAFVPRATAPTPVRLGPLLSPDGDAVAREQTDVALWHDGTALRLQARCLAEDMDRLRALLAERPSYERDSWGHDALEVQLDVGLTRREYAHFIFGVSGAAVTYRGFNNRQTQGWHPQFEFEVRLEDDAWTLAAALPFAAIGGEPRPGVRWGFNLLRVNPLESCGYVQWSPTFGDALRPELFGTLTFAPELDAAGLETLAAQQAGSRRSDIEAYVRRAGERCAYFLAEVNDLDDHATLAALAAVDWTSWSEHLAQRHGPQALRWDATVFGAAGIPAPDRAFAVQSADQLVSRIGAWTPDAPDQEAFFLERLEALADAYLLTGRVTYVQAFERALLIHERLMAPRLTAVTAPRQHTPALDPYHDYQVIRAATLAYAYLALQPAGLSSRTHATVMRTILRYGRSAAFNIQTAYNAGNHQVYESAGLAVVAALFPEFSESSRWAEIASRAIRLHLEREVLEDGAYGERCGYHLVALSMTMQAVCTVRANALESRFAELMDARSLDKLARMHEWALLMTAPDGTMPAFGDFGAYSQIRFLHRGAAFFARPALAWPVRQWAPELVPPALTPSRPAAESVALAPSAFTIMRDGWDRDSFYMAVDHGPLGGQHSHVDNLGFVAYAYGQPIALDTGIGQSYDDPRYKDWYRDARAHNVVVVDELQPEKVARRTGWQATATLETLEMRSDGYRHASGIVHDRRIVFVRGIGWLIWDRLRACGPGDLRQRRLAWMLHTPFALQVGDPGTIVGTSAGGGMLLVAARPEDLAEPELAKRPGAVPVPAAAPLRLQDAVRRYPGQFVTELSELAWPAKTTAAATVEFAFFLRPYRGKQPETRLIPCATGWELHAAGDEVVTISNGPLGS